MEGRRRRMTMKRRIMRMKRMRRMRMRDVVMAVVVAAVAAVLECETPHLLLYLTEESNNVMA